MASFEALPSRVKRLIFRHLSHIIPHHDLPIYATVNRTFQEYIEALTFKEIHINPDQLIAFGDWLSPPRQNYLDTLRLYLPQHDFPSGSDLDQDLEQQRSNATFSRTIEHLLSILSTWKTTRREDHGGGDGGGISLEVRFDVPHRIENPTKTKARQRVSAVKHAKSVLPLELDVPKPAGSGDPEQLPVVTVVQGLHFYGRHVALASIVTLLSRLPRLVDLNVELEHDTRNDGDLAKRIDLTAGLEEHGSHIHTLRLRRPKGMTHHRHATEGYARNVFYDRLRQFSLRLRSFTFDDCIDAKSFLSPFVSPSPSTATVAEEPIPSSLAGVEIPYWMNLETLSIRNSYMIGKPYVRVRNRVAAYDRMHEMMTSAGRAARQMPRLRHLRMVQILLDDADLKVSKLSYRYQEKKEEHDDEEEGTVMLPVLRITGIEPSLEALQTWRTSINQVRLASLRVEFDVGMDSTGEEIE